MLFDGDTFEHDGATFRLSINHDSDHGTPWDNEDGHGPVSDWRRPNYNGRPDKAPGERMLCTDHRSARFYDFAEACRIARRDGWGWLPGRLETSKDADGQWHAYVRSRGNGKLLQLEAKDPDINKAIRSVYAQHRATMSPRAYAAGAAERDFERLQAWCNNQWSYVGVTVELCDDESEPMGETASLWGVESDWDEGIEETARELASEILSNLEAAT